ncbi:MAG: deoxycytidylate deaminase [bacterium]
MGEKGDLESKTSSSRPSWDDYFLAIARIVRTRSTCLRRQVGAVIVKDQRILSTGYNGAPREMKHCSEIGCIRQEHGIPAGERHELCRGIHAEQNAIVQAAEFGVSIRGATIYCTHFPCVLCTKLLINSGIRRLVVEETYPDQMSLDMLEEAGIEILIRKSRNFEII